MYFLVYQHISQASSFCDLSRVAQLNTHKFLELPITIKLICDWKICLIKMQRIFYIRKAKKLVIYSIFMIFQNFVLRMLKLYFVYITACNFSILAYVNSCILIVCWFISVTFVTAVHSRRINTLFCL